MLVVIDSGSLACLPIIQKQAVQMNAKREMSCWDIPETGFQLEGFQEEGLPIALKKVSFLDLDCHVIDLQLLP